MLLNLFFLLSLTFASENKYLNPEDYREEPNVGKINKYHHVNKNQIFQPWPEKLKVAVIGMGCFWVK